MNNFGNFVLYTNTLFKYYEENMTSYDMKNSDFIDPFTSIVTLALLNYKMIGSKISIKNNTLVIQDNIIFQGIIRKISGDCKNQLKILNQSIIHACKYYLSNVFRENDIDVGNIFTVAIKGLCNLKETYKQDDDTLKILTMYENIISKSLIDYDDMVHFLTNFVKLVESTSLEDNVNKLLDMKHDIYIQLHTIWNIEKLTIMKNLFKELDKKTTNQEHIISCINEIILESNEKIEKLLRKVMKK